MLPNFSYKFIAKVSFSKILRLAPDTLVWFSPEIDTLAEIAGEVYEEVPVGNPGGTIGEKCQEELLEKSLVVLSEEV